MLYEEVDIDPSFPQKNNKTSPPYVKAFSFCYKYIHHVIEQHNLVAISEENVNSNNN